MGNQLSYMALAMKGAQTAYRSLLTLPAAVVADSKPMLTRLARGFIAPAFTACVLSVACSHRLADAVNGGQLRYMALAM